MHFTGNRRNIHICYFNVFCGCKTSLTYLFYFLRQKKFSSAAAVLFLLKYEDKRSGVVLIVDHWNFLCIIILANLSLLELDLLSLRYMLALQNNHYNKHALFISLKRVKSARYIWAVISVALSACIYLDPFLSLFILSSSGQYFLKSPKV